ncbi:YfhO family protein [Mangrovivirga sp. M17]|uniref:YfhO family protein n=1 Tax=Mangrovivirga halotolerans TaxID=2993936 RepID=A0ABT3RLB7_9BACT|nr:YfhO family protein [Mangrovivirga halotolerans]MCX2742407.1 YfhO family protein [Mangrovivirga halotolerans]
MKLKKINFASEVLPHIIAIIVFLLITVGFFSPVFFDNMAINQHDITQWKGGAQSVIEYRENSDKETLWADGMFSGMPAYLVNVNWSNGPVKALHQIFSIALPHPVKMIFIAFLSFYILLLSYKVRPYIAIAGAISFGLSSFIIIGLSAGHNARIGAIAYMPLVLAGIKLVFRDKLLLGAALTAAALALHLRLNHLQITYYLLFIVFAFGINELVFAIKENQFSSLLKKVGILVVAAIIGVGTFAGEMAATYKYSKYSIRGKSPIESVDQTGLSKDYAFEYSNGTFEWMTIFIPNIYGGSQGEELSEDSNVANAMAAQGFPQNQIRSQIKSLPTYWGDQRLTAPYYAGAISCFLFIIGIIFADSRNKWWIVTISVIGIFLSMGDNFPTLNYFLFDHFPLYNKFRSVTFTIIITIFAINLLGFIGLNELLKNEFNKAIQKKFLIGVGVASGICLLVILVSGGINTSGAIDQQLNAPAWFTKALKEDRVALMRADSFRSLIYVLLAAAAIFFTMKKKISLNIGMIAIIVLVLIDHWSVDNRYFGDKNFVKARNALNITKTPADQAILSDPAEHYRVLNLANPFNEARTSYFHESIGGYHGAKLGRYQDLIEYNISPEMQSLVQNLQSGNASFNSIPVINMLNTKYIKYGNNAEQVIKNPEANGPAWAVSQVKELNSAKAVLENLSSVNTESTALVYSDDEYKVTPGSYNANAQISLTKYEPSNLVYNAKTSGKAVFVFSDIFYPEGWTATVNGKETPIKRVNYLLRAIEIDSSGDFEIILNFRPEVYYSLNPITATSSWLLIIVLIIGIGSSFVSKKD